jgi:hypothetical protein
MPFKQTQQWIAAAITLFFSVQAIGECISALPKTEELNYERCTTTWTPKSCDTLGTWEAPYPYLEGVCEARGCSVEDAGSKKYCGGIPCCNIGNTGNTLICRRHHDCACIPGYKMVGGSCQEILCEGKYVLGETLV